MAERRPAVEPALEERIAELLDEAGARQDRDQLREILVSAVGLAGDGATRLDLKIANATLSEMREAFAKFLPFADVPKVTIFGSARVRPDDPLYHHTVALARALAQRGWMVVTGAGPGIMAAGMEGAGRDRAFGVRIRLPFEPGANDVIAGDEKLVEMKYFFTRKLMLVKESEAFVSLPGGFGTLDEVMELLTLLQTGKTLPVPVVLLDVPGGSYWQGWRRWVEEEVLAGGFVSAPDLDLATITDQVEQAVDEIVRFYRMFHSLRHVGKRTVLRLRAEPSSDELRALNDEFGDILVDGHIEASGPLPAEVATADHLELPRLVMAFDRRSHGRLLTLIRTLDSLPSAPAAAALPPTSAEQDEAADRYDSASD